MIANIDYKNVEFKFFQDYGAPSGDCVVARLPISRKKLMVICRQWQITELALFGSVLREDFREDSDIDLLVSFAPEAPQGLLTLAKIKHQFEEILHRKVDLVVKAAIEEGDNWIRRQEILNSAVIIYES